MESVSFSPAFASGTIPYITNSLYFMVPGAFPVLRSFQRRRMSLFTANQLKCLSMKCLCQKISFSGQAQSSPIKPNQGVFLNRRAPPIRHSHTLPFRLGISRREPQMNR